MFLSGSFPKTFDCIPSSLYSTSLEMDDSLDLVCPSALPLSVSIHLFKDGEKMLGNINTYCSHYAVTATCLFLFHDSSWLSVEEKKRLTAFLDSLESKEGTLIV